MARGFSIARDFQALAPFLDQVRAQSDCEKEALGFLPHAAYLEYAQQRKLLVLIHHEQGGSHYAGHLLFSGMFPHMKVQQIAVSPCFRRHGYGTTLLRALMSQAEREGYLSISASVASDLQAANRFYERNGFATARTRAGGIARARLINLRIHELSTPSLLNLMKQDDSLTANLELPAKRPQVNPLYCIDLNVFFDVTKTRERTEMAGALFSAALNHEVRIAVTPEFISELERTSTGAADPTLSLARRLPVLPRQPRETVARLKQEIAPLVFPDRVASGLLKPADLSDVAHLAFSICAGVSGYITSDGKVLMARDLLMERFGLDVIGLSEFLDLIQPPPERTAISYKSTKYFNTGIFSADDVVASIAAEGITFDGFADEGEIRSGLGTCLQDESHTIGHSVSIPSSSIRGETRVIVIVDQENPFSATAAEFLLSKEVRRYSARSCASLALLDIPSHPITRRVAMAHGFTTTPSSPDRLLKVAVGKPVTPESWSSVRLAVERQSGLRLPQKLPDWHDRYTLVNESPVSIFSLETLLSPTILMCSGRNGVIVPIMRSFADQLLETNPQYSFLDVPEAQFLSRRTYFNTPRAASSMTPGMPIVFYESSRTGGRGCAVGIARISQSALVSSETVPEQLRRGGVVDRPDLLTQSSKVLATTFDNLIVFPRPVTIAELRQIGCVGKANLVSATRITDNEIRAILEAAWAET